MTKVRPDYGSKVFRRVEALDMMRLDMVLAELVRRYGVLRAAEELGVSYQTLRRSRLSGRMSPGLKAALERYFLDGPGQTESEWWRRIEELEAQVQSVVAGRRQLDDLVKQEVQKLAERLDEVLKVVAEGQRSIAVVNQQMMEVSRFVETHSTLESQQPSPDRGATVNRASSQDNQPGQPVVEVQRGGKDSEKNDMVMEWQEAVAAEQKAKSRLERAKAAERLLEVEIAIIQDHRETVPPGEKWYDAKREKEIAWRWGALRKRRRERSRLELRRWLRRILTLGLWWR